MSTTDDDQRPDTPPTKEETLRRMEQARARLEADIKQAQEDLRAMPETPGLERAAGDWRKAKETGHNEEDDERA